MYHLYKVYTGAKCYAVWVSCLSYAFVTKISSQIGYSYDGEVPLGLCKGFNEVSNTFAGV